MLENKNSGALAGATGAEITEPQGGIVIVIAPPGDPDLDLAQVLSRPVVSMLIAVPRGRADYAAKWTEFWTSCGAYVIAQVDDARDLHLFEAALARRRDEIQ